MCAPTPTQADALESAIAALQAQRALLGDAVVDTAIAPLRAQMAKLEGAQQRLKHVSVLFVDIVGVPTEIDDAAADAALALVQQARQAFVQLIQQQRGRVLQTAGDSVLAGFGVDAVHEDDAERAVRAGLALRDEAQRLFETAPPNAEGERLGVKLGVHTGAVLLGGGVSEDGSIRGLTVNLAARMEQSAPAGTLRISQDTWRHVAGLFDVQAQPPLLVKGHDQPLVTYFVRGVAAPPFVDAARGVEGLLTSMVGRDAELAQLQAAWTSTCRQGRLQVVSVLADAGLGKSRLLREFEPWAAVQPTPRDAWRARALPQTQRQPYGLLRDLLARRYGLDESDSLQAAQRKLVDGIAPQFLDDGPALAEAHAHVLGHLVGLDFGTSPHLRGIVDDGRQLQTRALHTAAQLLRRAASPGRPVMLLLDDLHWADDGSLHFVTQLLKLNRDVPMLVLALARPALHERRPGWPGANVPHMQLTLAPLADAGRDALADALLQAVDQPALLRPLLLERSGGNPYFMEELLKMLIDNGTLRTDQQPWQLRPERLQAARVPGTLTGVLQARLDALPAAERTPLQQASVLGLQFHDMDLAGLDAAAPDALPALTRRALLREPDDDVATLSDDEAGSAHVFAHQLLHQVAYDTMLKGPRRAWHARAAAHLRSLRNARASALAGVIGEHHERADERPQAAEAYTRAAEQAATQFTHDSVVDYATRALHMLGNATDADSAELRWRALLARNRALRNLGRREEHDADMATLLSLADASGDDARRAQVQLRHAVGLSLTGQLQAAADGARAALLLAQGAGADAVAIAAHNTLAGALRVLGQGDEAQRVVLAGIALARQRDALTPLAELLNVQAASAAEHGDLAGAMGLFEESLGIARRAGARFAEATTLVNLGECASRLGNRERARHVLEEALMLTRALGMRGLEAMALTNLSGLLQRHGEELPRAQALAQAARERAQAVGNREFEVHAALAQGQAALALGALADAQVAFTAAQALLLELGLPLLVLEPLAGLAQVALALGDLPAALQHIAPVLADEAAGSAFEGLQQPLWVRLVCVRVLQAAGDGRARQVLARAAAQLQALADGLVDVSARQALLHNIVAHREIAAAAAGFSAAG